MSGISLAADWAVIGYNTALAIFHALFWRLFGWPDTLEPSGRRNEAITQTLNVMLTYVFAAFAAAMAWAMWTSSQAPTLLLAIASGFWLLRAALQPVLFSLPLKWNVGLTAIWLLGAIIHAAAAVS
jgi:hypothetical protein